MHGYINLAGVTTSYDQILHEDIFALKQKYAGVRNSEHEENVALSSYLAVPGPI